MLSWSKTWPAPPLKAYPFHSRQDDSILGLQQMIILIIERLLERLID